MFTNDALATCTPALEQLGRNGPLEDAIDRVVSRAKLIGRDRFGGPGFPDEKIVGQWFVFADLTLLIDPATGHGPRASGPESFSLFRLLDGGWILLAVTDRRLLGYIAATQKHGLYPSNLAFSWPYEHVGSVSLSPHAQKGSVDIISSSFSMLSIETAKRPLADGRMKNLGVPNQLDVMGRQIAEAGARFNLARSTDPAMRSRLERVVRGEYELDDDGDLVAWMEDPDEVNDADADAETPASEISGDRSDVTDPAADSEQATASWWSDGAPAEADQTRSSPAAWHPDPRGRHELRYWNGDRWTHHVSDQGRTGTDPV